MVRFTKKESEARKQLLESTNQMNDAKETENGKKPLKQPQKDSFKIPLTCVCRNKSRFS